MGIVRHEAIKLIFKSKAFLTTKRKIKFYSEKKNVLFFSKCHKFITCYFFYSKTVEIGLNALSLCFYFVLFLEQRLFKEYKVHQFQMMAGVNIFSTSFSGLLCAPKFFSVFAFCTDHPDCIFHIFCMSCCSAVGKFCYCFFFCFVFS